MKNPSIKSDVIDMKIIKFLEDNSEIDYTRSDIVKGTRLSYTTIRIHMEHLIKLGKVRVTRRIGDMLNLYQLKDWGMEPL